MRAHERLSPGVEAEARIAALRLEHGRAAVRVTGRSKASRARWTGQRTELRVSYPRK